MIECKEVSFSLQNRKILKHINLFFQEGEIVGIIGPSGCGKSTLLNILAGNMKSHEGEVLVNKRPIQSYSSNEKARLISTIPPVPGNMEISVFEFLLLSRRPFKKLFNPFTENDYQIVDEYLEEFELTSYRNNLLNNLSPSQLKLVLTAFAFTRNADIIILDDATNLLDLRGLMILQKITLRYVIKGSSLVIISSNDINFIAQTVDKIAIMVDGSIELIGGYEIIEAEIIKRYFNVDVFISKNVYNGRPNVHFFPEG